MEAIKDLFSNIDAYISKFWNVFLGFCEKEYYTVYAGIVFIAALLMLIGLFTALKKFPKFFIFVVLLVGAFCAAAYFIYYK